MIEPGSIVRGNWSTIEYVVDHAWQVKGKDYWCINGKAVDNPLSSGYFSNLGKRVGNEITIVKGYAKGDRLLILKEPPKKVIQMTLPL